MPTKNKKILILHGWDASPEDHWFSKAKELFEKQGWVTFIPQLPGNYFPKKDDWLKVIEDLQVDENWVLIGHSLGGVAILKYLEMADKPIAKAILIATPFNESDFNPLANFFDHGFNFEKIKKNCQNFEILNETDDPVIAVEDGKNFQKKLKGRLHILPGGTHFHKLDLEFLVRLIGKTG